ncbi:GNAT family N-acetyltransferase [Haloplanus halophilus]|uniref:GNAT family N-acetyltransferase n=1 Tax=Haloplanus halophilus TaxID=2949993 RepID=UPI00203ECED5|nr:GNAT family N-acetyltransferase [Haloplanus sp. GDY1]
MVSLREAVAADADEMARIQSASLRRNAREHYTEAQLAHLAPAEPDTAVLDAEFAGESTRPIVAEADGTIVGWGSVHLDENVLAATFVDPDYAGRGIGRAIVDELEAIARREGVERLRVPASLNAVGFYEALGFERRREIDASGPDAPEIPAIELTKEL